MNNQDSRLPEPFDSFVVGSLPRPKWVMEVVESRKRGDILDKNFQSILDSAVPFAITLMENGEGKVMLKFFLTLLMVLKMI